MTKQLQDELLPKLLQFERNEEYNICGDKALHMCILAAYTYEEKNPSRKFLLQLAKELIKELNEDENVKINNAPWEQTQSKRMARIPQKSKQST